MKIVIAMDSFKGSLDANQACEIVAKAILESSPAAKIVTKPMADGGQGTAKAMIKAANGRWIQREVMGPLADMKVESGFAWFEQDKTALVEMASASGLQLLSKKQANPFKTTTYGTGQLVKAALEYGASEILLAVGDSATVDGGVGAAMALGWKFLDDKNQQVPLGGAALGRIQKIVKPENFEIVPVKVLCDVDNPLCGEYGAARIYGPQKGADRQMIEQLERGLAHLASLVHENLECDIKDIPGAGAAGGLAAGAIAFMNATVVSGIGTVMERSNLADGLEDADWLITGEGCFDSQSLRGKVVSGVSKLAAKLQTRIAVIAGQVSVPKWQYSKLGIETAISCRPENMTVDHAVKDARNLLYDAARRFAKEFL